MPPKQVVPTGELTGPELRKLIRAHNILSKITIPKGTDRNGLIALIQKRKYKVNHKKKSIEPMVSRREGIITLKKAEELTKPKVLTEEQIKKKQQAKQKKEGEKAFLKQAIPKPPPVSKPSKPVKVGKPPPKPKMKKEDDIRPAKIPYPTIPKNVKGKVVRGSIGGRPAGKKVNVGKLNPAKLLVDDGAGTGLNNPLVRKKKVSKLGVDKKKEKEKKPITLNKPKPQRIETGTLNKANLIKKKKVKKSQEEINKNKDKLQRLDGINRLKTAELRDYVNQYNLSKDRERELRSKGESKSQLVNKIVNYDIDKMFNIKVPEKKQRITKIISEEDKAKILADRLEKKKQKQKEAKEQRDKEKPWKPIRILVGQLYARYNRQLREGEYKDVKSLLKKMQNEFDEAVEELEEDAEKKDIELDDDVYEELDQLLDNYKTQLKSIAERGLKGEFSAEFKKAEKERLRKERDSK